MITPCKSICEIEKTTNICVGCGRTKEQIENWNFYTFEEQMEIMKKLGYGKRIKRAEKIRRYYRG